MEEILREIRQKGILLFAEGESLRYQAPKGAMTADILEKIKKYKAEILCFLQEAEKGKAGQKPVKREGAHPVCRELSYSQQALWFFDRMNKGSSLYNISNVFKIKGSLSPAYFLQAAETAAAGHESLHTVFGEKEGEPVRIIKEDLSSPLELKRLTSLREEEKETVIGDIMKEETGRHFDLEEGPLWKLTLIETGDEEHIVILVIHHIIADAWSNKVFLTEILEDYRSLAEGKELQIIPEEYTFSDYVYWQREQMAETSYREPLLKYWKEKLKDCENVLLPEDRVRPVNQSFEGDTVTYAVSEELTQKVKEICRKKDISLFMYLLACLEILISKYTSQQNVVLGTVVANRRKEEFRKLTGFLMNTIVIRENVDSNLSVARLLENVKNTVLDAFTHQELPFDKLLEELKPERSAAHTPLFQIMYIHQSVEETVPEIEGLSIEEIRLPSKIAPFDIRLSTREHNGGILFSLDYCKALYDAGFIRGLLESYGQLLAAMAEGWEKKLGELSLLSEAGEQRLTEGWNHTEKKYSFEKTVHELFEEKARENPQRIALCLGEQTVSYGELNRKANRMAAYLRTRGVKRNVPVAVCLPRSFEMIISLLAVMKAGGVYIPVDTGYPEERIAYMIQDAGAAVVITDREHQQIAGAMERERVVLTEEWESLTASFDGADLHVAVQMEDLAYIIYTSGSTGNPKGAMNTHRGFLNHKLWMRESFDITDEDVFLQKTPFSFDVSVWEIFLPLMVGARLVLAEPGAHKDPRYIARVMKKQGVSIVHFVPSMLDAFLEEPEAVDFKELRTMFVSGEALHYDLMVRAKEKYPIPIYNVYGPAECADVSTAWKCEREEEKKIVPIGKPISNVRVYILDKNLHPVPIGVPGDIYIGGMGVGKGYIHNENLTGEAFVRDIFVPYEAKMYKTGDIGKFLEDGNIAYLGRSDFQIKIRGMRIELEEIENCMGRYSQIKNCAAVVWERENGIKYLTAYYTEKEGAKVDRGLLKKTLKKHLPEYMVPGSYIKLDTMPLNPNGKLDRKALPKPWEIERQEEESKLLPQDQVQETIAAIWKKVLKIEEVGISDNFFEIGGNSLLLIQVHKKLEESFQVEFPLVELFTYSTIEAVSRFITGEENIKKAKETEREKKPEKEEKTEKKEREEGAGTGKVAVIGMAGRFPQADNIEQYWHNLREGKECITFFTREDAAAAGVAPEDYENKNYVCAGGLLEGIEYFDEQFFGINPREADVMDPQQRIFLECAYHALEDAGYAQNAYEMPVGVFAGANMSTYFLYHLSNPTVVKDDFLMTIGNDKDYISTRTSYALNLKGPSITVQTACSTSMTAVSAACDSLNSGQCDLAVAGGVSVKLPQKMGYLYQEGMMLSKDGHTRPFDDCGEGMLFSDAAGAVILKRLEDAVGDRDHIYAVVEGIAVNNDGAEKAGFIAPSREGQAAVIRKAHELAKVKADRIGYVEAHGTGTRMGDQIAVGALQKVFEKETAQKQCCAMGSVKGNIGHAVSASGIAGFMKTALILEKGEIPPTINYQTPNRGIEFENGPFYVNTGLKEWKEERRMAEVSSFGFGGTNVHAVLGQAEKKEEIPCEAEKEQERSYLLILSAKSQTALAQMRVNCARFLRDRKEISFPDAIYTWQVGRRQLPYRLALICKNAKEASEALFNIEAGNVMTGRAERSAAYGKAEEEILQRAALGAQGALLALADHWIKGGEVEWRQLYPSHSRGRISLPVYPYDRKRHWIVPDRGKFQITESCPAGQQEKVPEDRKEDTQENTQIDAPVEDRKELQPGEEETNRPELESEYEAPCTGRQEELAGLWEELMGIYPVGIRDDFFELGGDSMMAAQMVMEINKKYGIEIWVIEFMRNTTIEQLAVLVEEKLKKGDVTE